MSVINGDILGFDFINLDIMMWEVEGDPAWIPAEMVSLSVVDAAKWLAIPLGAPAEMVSLSVVDAAKWKSGDYSPFLIF